MSVSECCLELRLILEALEKYGLPSGFDNDEVKPMFNRDSGNVFLTNSDYQVAMLNGSKLKIWHICPNCGEEGFEEDMTINECCEQYIKEFND